VSDPEQPRGSSVNHPPHYNADSSGVECIQVVKWMTFCLGSAVKYVWRRKEKGREVEDLNKAIWYLEFHHREFALENDLVIRSVPEAKPFARAVIASSEDVVLRTTLVYLDPSRDVDSDDVLAALVYLREISRVISS
jgi:Protein of unknwon function (DUF3310)